MSGGGTVRANRRNANQATGPVRAIGLMGAVRKNGFVFAAGLTKRVMGRGSGDQAAERHRQTHKRELGKKAFDYGSTQ